MDQSAAPCDRSLPSYRNRTVVSESMRNRRGMTQGTVGGEALERQLEDRLADNGSTYHDLLERVQLRRLGAPTPDQCRWISKCSVDYPNKISFPKGKADTHTMVEKEAVQ